MSVLSVGITLSGYSYEENKNPISMQTFSAGNLTPIRDLYESSNQRISNALASDWKK